MDFEPCERCKKDKALCVCATIVALPTKKRVLLLQHPQEPDKDLGSALLAHLSLPASTLRVGLSWANLKAALGDVPVEEAQPSRWAVLYLGSGARQPGPAQGKSIHENGKKSSVKPAAQGQGPALLLLDKKGAPLADQGVPLDGIVVLDGTWSQAKTLWWRNAWLLKLRRAVLSPSRPSLYRELRREPRRECLSTIESVAEALVALGEPPAVGDGLRGLFGRLLDKQRTRYHRPPAHR